MTQSDQALVSPMPLHLPFPVPSLFAWVVGAVVAWALLLFLGHDLRDTAMGKRFLLVASTFLGPGLVFLLLMLLDTGATLIFRVTIQDVLIGLVWGTAFDLVMLLLCFCLTFRWQDAEVEPRSPLFRPTDISNTSRPTGQRPARNTTPSYSNPGNRPMHTRTRKALPKRKPRKS